MTYAVDREKRMSPAALAAPLAASLGLFYASAAIPPLGLFAPAPLYYALAAQGLKNGLVLTAAGAACVLVISGVGGFVLFSVSCGLMALSLARSRMMGETLEKTMARAVLTPYAAGAAVFLLATALSGTSPGAALASWGEELVGALAESYRDAGVAVETADWLEENGAVLVDTFVRIFPSMALVSVVLMAGANMAVIRAASIKFNLGIHPAGHSLSAWRTPDIFVWGVVAGGFGSAFLDGAAYAVALNTLIGSLAAFALQGLGITSHFFVSRNIPVFLRAIGYFIIFSHPLILGLISALGLSDVWVDFRNRDAKEED
ncbi:MAG: DUF2232 domain-containing protein [Candidatus Nitrospinota bacterium M3_3B_026]